MSSILSDFYIIGQENFNNWSNGYNSNGYLKVLPQHQQKVLFKDPFQDWQQGRSGNYFSSWGPDQQLEVTLTLQDLTQVEIEGFGIVKAGDGIIPWLNNKPTPFEFLRGYNGTIPGPMLIVDPGDTLKITLKNDLNDPQQGTNFHFHGGHISPLGHGDNVLINIPPGNTWTTEIKIPDNHEIGPAWYHPHLHGLTNEQLASGLAGYLLVNPKYNLPDLDKWNPKEMPMHFMALNSFGIQQINRPGKPGDPLNQNPQQAIPAGTPLKVLGQTQDGKPIYELSDAVGIGKNALPASYDPAIPTGDPSQLLFEYGGGVLKGPVENVIHTVNGQYNPTLEVATGQWNMFSFLNQDPNAFHVLQLVKEENGQLIPQEMSLIGMDTDLSGLIEDNKKEVNTLPILNPGSRISMLEWFEKPGTYYLLSNATSEILGDKAPLLTRDEGAKDGRFKWPPQVLATIEVTGDEIPKGAFPEAYDTLKQQDQKTKEMIAAVENGDFERERDFVWTANIGGAIAEGNSPDDTEVETFEGSYKINGGYFSSDPSKLTPLTMSMLDTYEVWNIINESGKSDPSLPVDIPLLEWHPFHQHQNSFVVLEINGIKVSDMDQTYLAGVLSDTIALPPTYKPGTVTPENPYGEAMLNGTPSNVKILMNFKDFPGTFVNHCHILFHEDAGMMAPVRVILNTNNTWLGLGAKSNAKGQVELIRASDLDQRLYFKPYGNNFKGAIDVAIGDVNYKQKPLSNYYVTDNVTDIVTVQRSLTNPNQKFTVKVFDGQTLIDEVEQGRTRINNPTANSLIGEITPFNNLNFNPNNQASVATGDINGDGYSDIVVGVGGRIKPQIEIYSGKDFSLLSRISPFHHETYFKGKVNLAVGDVNGDNFDDIIIGQGRGGRGLVEIYSGILIQQQQSLDGIDVSHKTSLISETFKPFGDGYKGEVDVTSGYILQRPQVLNGKPVQTHYANITTLAVDGVPSDLGQIRVFTHVGEHGAHSSHETMAAPQAADSGHDHEYMELRLDAQFTPDRPISQLMGTFIDIPDSPRGEPALYTLNDAGNPEIIRLQENNVPETITLKSAPTIPKNVTGTPENDYFDSASPEPERYFIGDNQILTTGNGDDIVDVTDAVGNNRIETGNGNDIIFAGSNNRLIGGAGNDQFFVGTGEGNNRIWGNSGADSFYIVTDEQNLVTKANQILDFNPSQDKIILANTSFNYNSLGTDWKVRQEDQKTIIQVFNQDVAVFANLQASALNRTNVLFS
ncbi:multicopper oxidase domain-containing protein [Gloeothece verrucosa]|uniref:Multicopper oxidase type 3 n=1 Tax=Gloeothece verrucosa (strain PCC 7822) TaxID=497965 RepID=E0ULM9_GLOV7|nr:multicopper oxidase domain-containing protein [Gloeothece verrucosa]ADN17859.1 multicopper oxidase type 3 [Gloeothece verrucosa PCC 7822]